MRPNLTENNFRLDHAFDTPMQVASLKQLIDLEAIDRELDAIEREYRLSFAFVGVLGLCLFGALFATL